MYKWLRRATPTRPTAGIGFGAIALAVAMLLLTSCGTNKSGASGVTVVATTTILGDVAANIVGDNGTVEVLLPIGADPHDYQASARQVAAVQEADLVVVNGLGLEDGLAKVIDNAAGDGARVLTVAPLLDPLPFGAADPEAAGSDDPHVWFDPQRMARAARLIAAELAAVEPSVPWAERTEAYAADLIAADETIIEVLEAIPPSRRRLITNHDALGYFADRYGFTLVGVVIPGGSTLSEPSSSELAELVEVIAAEDVPAIFAETTNPAALAEAVAAEAATDVVVVELFTGSLGGPGSGATTLIEMLITNARRIAGALA